jgi:hypothetical protein
MARSADADPDTDTDTDNNVPEHERRRQLAETFIVDMVKHGLTEELFAYPLMRKVLPKGNAAVDADMREHLHLDGLLRDLECAHEDEREYQGIVRKIYGLYKVHR